MGPGLRGDHTARGEGGPSFSAGWCAKPPRPPVPAREAPGPRSPWSRPGDRSGPASLVNMLLTLRLSTRTQISTALGKQFGNALQEPANDQTHPGMSAWVSTLRRQSNVPATEAHHRKGAFTQLSKMTFIGHLMVQEWAPGCMFNYTKKSKTQNYKNFIYI